MAPVGAHHHGDFAVGVVARAKGRAAAVHSPHAQRAAHGQAGQGRNVFLYVADDLAQLGHPGQHGFVHAQDLHHLGAPLVVVHRQKAQTPAGRTVGGKLVCPELVERIVHRSGDARHLGPHLGLVLLDPVQLADGLGDLGGAHFLIGLFLGKNGKELLLLGQPNARPASR